MSRSDEWLQEQGGAIAKRLLLAAIQLGDDPEDIWIILSLAARGAEQSLLYTLSRLPEQHKSAAGADYAAAKERLERLLKESQAIHDATAESTDKDLGLKRGAPQ